MKVLIIAVVLLVASSTLVLSQGYNNKQHPDPYSHTNSKKTGQHPGSYPTGYNGGHRKQPPGYSGGGYGPPTHGGYGPPPHAGGGYGGPYGGGYGYPHYEKCYPEYRTFGQQESHLRYLATANEDTLNQNVSNFRPHSLPIFNPKCAQGPKRILHTVYGEWHYPPVVKGKCDNLPGCKDPKCIPVQTIKKTVCVLVFRRYGYRWIRVGFRKISFKTDTKCKCRECQDIKSYKECVHTYPCPNKHLKKSYCYWKKIQTRSHKRSVDELEENDKFFETEEETFEIDSDSESTELEDTAARVARSTHEYENYDRYDRNNKKDPYDPYKHTLRPVPAGQCACCTPYVCHPPQQFDYDNCRCVCPKKKCLPGHKFNSKTCQCECPSGTVMDKKRMRCIGVCKKVSTKACEHVVCKDNPHFYCKLDKKHKCRCPDCDDVDYWQRGLCKKTSCIDQSYHKPKCVFDWRNGRCRCPECADQKNPRDCEKTVCDADHSKRNDPNYKRKDCRWTWYPYPSCVCRPPGYGTNKSHAPKPTGYSS